MAASRQSYYTIRLLADRDQVQNAYRAYAYFRWVDDQVDERGRDALERLLFIERQKSILERCRRGQWPPNLEPEEWMLVELLAGRGRGAEGLDAYLDNMMAVMSFDAGRRGRLISERELANYTRQLAVGVTEALHHFIGRGCAAQRGGPRYEAVTGAHITHMLRDSFEDLEAGYVNVPREYLEANRLEPADLHAAAYVQWVESRVKLARRHLAAGLKTFAQLGSARCRLAGYAYVARFTVVLDAIERDRYLLRPSYPQRRGLAGAVSMSRWLLSQLQQPPYAQGDELVPR
jgi:phytoene/squalene synthetase